MDDQPSPFSPPAAPANAQSAGSGPGEVPVTEVPVVGLPVPEMPVTEVTVTETAAPSAGRRTGLIVTVAAVVLAALGLGAFFLFRSDTPEFSLKEAAANTDSQKFGVSFTSTSSVMGQDITATALGTPDGKFLQMKMDLGASMAAIGITEPIEAIVNVEDRVMYMGSGFFSALGAPVDTPWIKIDREAAEAAGQDTSFFDQIQVDDPTDTTALFAKATEITTIGDEEIDGEKVRHYRVSVPAAEVLTTNPSLGDMLDQLEADLPDTIDYDVWVTKDNRFRRLGYELELGVTALATTIDFERLTEPVVITEPAADEVTDALDLG